MVNDHGDRKSPKDRVVGPLPYMAMKMAEINGGDPITTYIHWDDPPSTRIQGAVAVST